MNEELQKKLVELINGAQSAGKEAFLFSKEQIPDIINQLLMWKLGEAILQIIFSLVLAYVVYRISKPTFAEIRKETNGDIGNMGIMVFGGVSITIFALFGAAMFCDSVEDILKITVAPKVYLIEYAQYFVKK